MPSDHDNGWSPRWVMLNTWATILASVSGLAALVIALIALLH
jgi:hypothetical protein